MAADAEKLRAQAERIQQLRDEKSRRDGKFISQETAAHEIGVSARTYRTWEGTGADLKLENLKALAGYYETTIDYIQCGPEGRVAETPEPFANGELTQLDRIELELAGVKRAQLEQVARDMEAQKRLEGLEDAIRRLQPPPQ